MLLDLTGSESSLDEAVERSRIHFEAGTLSAETEGRGAGELEAAMALAARHELFDKKSLFFGGVNVVRRRANGELEAAADSRREGSVRIVE